MRTCIACGNDLTRLERKLVNKHDARPICVRCRQCEVDLDNGAIRLDDTPYMFQRWFRAHQDAEARGER